MIRTKVIADTSPTMLNDRINSALENLQNNGASIIDIKHSLSIAVSQHSTQYVIYSVVIIYKVDYENSESGNKI